MEVSVIEQWILRKLINFLKKISKDIILNLSVDNFDTLVDGADVVR